MYVCIFRQHFYVNANFIEHNRHFMPTYSLLDPFEFPYYFYRIRDNTLISSPPNTIKVIREFERIQKRICRHKMSIVFNEICIYIYIYIYIYTPTHVCYIGYDMKVQMMVRLQ